MRRLVDAGLVFISVACALIAAVLAMTHATQTRAYHALALEQIEDTAAGDHEEADRDWRELAKVNPDVAGWLTVEGTPINYPVVHERADGEGWYLHHDFWGGKSAGGCPYLPSSCTPEGDHLLIYGHHMGWSDQMFSPLADAWRQERFDSLGEVHFATPADGTTVLEPLFALRVDETFEPIQTYEFPTTGALRDWLQSLSRGAEARNPDLEGRIGASRRALTLVTCSSVIPGQRGRTLVVFG